MSEKLKSLNTLNYRKYTGDLPEPVVGFESNTGKDGNTTYRIPFGQGEQSPPDPLTKPSAKNRAVWQA